MPSLKNLKAPPSLKEMAFQSIKSAILSQKLLPGDTYNEQVLAKELGISKTPVREALLDLSHKGFVTFIQRKGVQINVLARKDIKDLYEVRRALETAAIGIVMQRLTDEDLQRIEVIYEKGNEAIKANDLSGYMRSDREFHISLVNLTENRYMIAAIENIRDLLDWMGLKALSRADLLKIQQEHNRIIVGLRERNIDGAEQSVEDHIQLTMQKVLEIL